MNYTDIQMVGRGEADKCPKCGSKRLWNAGLYTVIEIAPHQYSPKLICRDCQHEFVEDTRLTPDYLPELTQDHLLQAGREFAQRMHEAEVKLRDDTITKVLKEIYAVRGDPSREHTLVFHGTPEEFAFFKARLDEWARKRIT